MKTRSLSNSLSLPDDDLFQVERRIARRADELERLFGTNPRSALDHWRQAEAEVWDRRLTLRRQQDSGRVIGEVFAV
jgi:hypothetical protein